MPIVLQNPGTAVKIVVLSECKDNEVIIVPKKSM